jgi:hypothetical protein
MTDIKWNAIRVEANTTERTLFDKNEIVFDEKHKESNIKLPEFKINYLKYGTTKVILPSISLHDNSMSVIDVFSKNVFNYAKKEEYTKFKFSLKIDKAISLKDPTRQKRCGTINYIDKYKSVEDFIDDFIKFNKAFFDSCDETYSESPYKNIYYCVVFYTDKITKKNTSKKTKVGASFVELPYYIKKTKTVVNIKNNDNLCFLWSIFAHLYPQELNPNRVSKYIPYKDTLFTNFDWPMNVYDVEEFTKINKLNIIIYKLDNDVIELIYKNYDEGIKQLDPIHLLLYKNHYMYIKNLDGLFRCVLKTDNTVHVCYFCSSNYFYSIDALEKHMMNCPYNENECIFKLHQGGTIKFTNYYKMFRNFSCVYADFETVLKPISDQFGKTDTQKMTKHLPCAVGLCFTSSLDYIDEYYYLGEDCVERFLDRLEYIAKLVSRRFTNLSGINKNIPNPGKTCCIFCNKTDNNMVETESTDDFNKILGYSHPYCKQKYFSKIKTIPVIFHNLKNYDAHLFIDQLAQRFKNISCIPITKEKYITFKASHWVDGIEITFKFLDSIGFLTGSLASNASTLSSFKYINKIKSNIPWGNIENINTKLPFPYEYIKSFDVLKEHTLPQNEKDWFSNLKNTSPSENEILLAHKTFEEFNCQNIGDYMMLYLRIDVLLLVEIFEAFRITSMNEYKLDPLHYYTTPGLAWDSALAFSKVELDILNTQELVSFFIEKGVIRGGISTVSELKYAMANFTNDETKSNIMYYDVTNLYGYAMIQSLPTGNFIYNDYIGDESLKQVDFVLDLCKKYNDSDFKGYMFEVDIHYPHEKYEAHNALPFLVENVNGKLIPMLRNKLNYRLHICVLIQALNAGLVLVRVHKIISFNQSKWLSSYIMHNTNERAKTKDPNKKSFYKLMNNAVYGKTMENILNRSTFNIYDVKSFDLKMSRQDFVNKVKKITPLTENLLVCEENDMIPVYDKPIYIGFSILEISKRHMYFLLYDVIKIKWKSSILMYMDTDSLIVYITGKMNYEGVEKFFDLNSKGILGTLKDEYPKTPISKFICLKSKCYALVTNTGKTHIKNKGITDNSNLSFEEFENMLDSEIKGNKTCIRSKQYNFRSFNHQIYTVSTNKITLSSMDDKRKLNSFPSFSTCPLKQELSLYSSLPNIYFPNEQHDLTKQTRQDKQTASPNEQDNILKNN